MLGIPAALVYLGFTGDTGIQGMSDPFADDSDWGRAFESYIEGTFPLDLFEQLHDLGPAPVWLLSRSRPIIEESPPRQSREHARPDDLNR